MSDTPDNQLPPSFVVLGACGYNVTAQDGQIIFEEASPIWSTMTRFAFEKTLEINDTPGVWYFVDLDSSSHKVLASHLVAAHAYCIKHYGKCFEDPVAHCSA